MSLSQPPAGFEAEEGELGRIGSIFGAYYSWNVET
jgi:hypothetical protein